MLQVVAGMNKISDVRQTMTDKNADMLVVTGIDSCLHCLTGRSWDDKLSDIRQKMAAKMYACL